MHRVLRIEAVRLYELGSVDPLLPARSEKSFFLPAQVSEIPGSGAAREKGGAKFAQFLTELRLHEYELLGHEEEQQDRGVTLEGKPGVLPQVVRHEIEVTWPRPRSFGLSALDEVLEPVLPSANAPGAREPEQVLRRLREDGHLVPVVLASVMQAVDRRADGGPEDRAALDDLLRVHADLLSTYSGAPPGQLGEAPLRLPDYRAPRANSETSCGVAVSNPTTSSIPGSRGSAIEKPFETIPTTTRRASMPDARR